MIHTTTSTSQAGVRNSASASPTRTPLNPYSPAWMRPRSIPSACAASVDAMTPTVPAKPNHGSDPHGRQDEQTGDRAVHEHDLPDSAQAILKNPTTGMLCLLPSAGIVPSTIRSGL